MWQETSGSAYCQVTNGGMCVANKEGTSGTSGNYANKGQCTIRALTLLYATATDDFKTESCCDRIIIGTCSGFNNPRCTGAPINTQGLFMTEGGTMEWRSDSSISETGWTIGGWTIGGSTTASAILS